MAYTKYTVDTFVQLAFMYDLEDTLGDDKTISFNVACLCIVVTYVISLANYKQISYMARAVMLITLAVMAYITIYVLYKYTIQKSLVEKVEIPQ